MPGSRRAGSAARRPASAERTSPTSARGCRCRRRPRTHGAADRAPPGCAGRRGARRRTGGTGAWPPCESTRSRPGSAPPGPSARHIARLPANSSRRCRRLDISTRRDGLEPLGDDGAQRQLGADVVARRAAGGDRPPRGRSRRSRRRASPACTGAAAGPRSHRAAADPAARPGSGPTAARRSAPTRGARDRANAAA